ncbi:mismatch repair protein MLH3 [Maudiozyma barnettii]|uniref:Similar to Saccharomyces cerevisiae YPL164C MLH3 Protein involved in DNA mismatch repair and crossing-over during meiotic recombination n=1 Tax=Maudiozyma barnettii TaxID=61262 RepID=A0A8H2ZGF4_9SACH|nr:mismatch repair protein MLH3 [Kazachstania barnettii]CAB4252710.1 similar to Saccharomyces cerevisiae YPL164C MLH3 Protein involved in DNA mismatch repair and crossing-over during meiotic recombination [Kazachstania barnettii]
MPDSIQLLDADVLSKLQSQVHVISIASAINEVIQNSIDAKATNISVLLDLDTLSFQVEDDGTGIAPADMNLICKQHYTSKIKLVKDLADVKTYGFQGMALHSINSISDMCIISKAKDYSGSRIKSNAYITKLYSEQNTVDDIIGLPIQPFDKKNSGTILIARNLMYNLPVRSNMAKAEPQYRVFNAIREYVLRLLIQVPAISISVSYVTLSKDLDNLLKYQGLNKCDNMSSFDKYVKVLRSVYGCVVPFNTLKGLSLKYKEYFIEGVISKSPVKVKHLQFININRRTYNNPALFKLINSMFKEYKFEPQENMVTYVGRPYKFYPIFFINIKGPKNINDLIQDPSKCVVEATLQHIIDPLIIRTFKSFLITQGYMTPNDNTDVVTSFEQTFSSYDSWTNKHNANILLDSNIRAGRYQQHEINGRGETFSLTKSTTLTKTTKIRKPSLKRLRSKHSKSSVLKKISNVVLEVPDDHSLTESYCSHSLYSNREFSITKDDLSKCCVINQVDTKFILMKVVTDLDNIKAELYILDQHACDERIKLEQFLSQLLADVLSDMLYVQPIASLKFEVSAVESNLFEHFDLELRRWGVHTRIERNFSNESSQELKHTVFVDSLSDELLNKCGRDPQFLKGVLLQHMDNLSTSKKLPILPLIDRPNQTQDTFDSENTQNWWKLYNYIPTFYLEIFNSKACRSAIMFGDELTKMECKLLVRNLSKCQQPFQCAHGRPSIVPVSEISDCMNHTDQL